jgi:serine/threonine-protein kinase RsbT
LSADTPERLDRCPIRVEADVPRVRALLREHAQAAGIGAIDQTKLVTAASELTRNILKYAVGGEVRVEAVSEGRRRGVRAMFVDEGPGIGDVGKAMQDGYSTGGSLGLGLPGAKRLVDAFEIVSRPGEGTTVVITKWAR